MPRFPRLVKLAAALGTFVLTLVFATLTLKSDTSIYDSIQAYQLQQNRPMYSHRLSNEVLLKGKLGDINLRIGAPALSAQPESLPLSSDTASENRLSSSEPDPVPGSLAHGLLQGNDTVEGGLGSSLRAAASSQSSSQSNNQQKPSDQTHFWKDPQRYVAERIMEERANMAPQGLSQPLQSQDAVAHNPPMAVESQQGMALEPSHKASTTATIATSMETQTEGRTTSRAPSASVIVVPKSDSRVLPHTLADNQKSTFTGSEIDTGIRPKALGSQVPSPEQVQRPNTQLSLQQHIEQRFDSQTQMLLQQHSEQRSNVQPSLQVHSEKKVSSQYLVKEPQMYVAQQVPKDSQTAVSQGNNQPHDPRVVMINKPLMEQTQQKVVRTLSNVTPESRVAHIQHSPESRVAPVPNIHESHITPVLNSPQSHVVPVQNIPESRISPVRNVPESRISPVQNVPESRIALVQSGPETSQVAGTVSRSRAHVPLSTGPAASNVKRHGYILSTSYYEQQSMGSRNLFQLQCWAKTLNLSVVRPVMKDSVWRTPLNDKKQQMYTDFGDIFSLEDWSHHTERSKYAPLVDWKTFLSQAPRKLIIVQFEYASVSLIKMRQKAGEPIVHKAKEEQYTRGCTTKWPRSPDLVYLRSKGFQVVRTVCFNFYYGDQVTVEEFNSHLLGTLSAGEVTIMMELWRGIGTAQRVVMDTSCREAMPIQEYVLPSDTVVQQAGNYAKKYLNDSPYLAILGRLEMSMITIHKKVPMIPYCLEETLKEWESFVQDTELQNTFVALDVGRYGSQGLRTKEGPLYVSEVDNFLKRIYGDTMSLPRWEGTFDHILQSQDAGYIAQLQQVIVTRAKCVLFVGGGAFQRHALHLYRTLHPDPKDQCLRVVKKCTSSSKFVL